MNADRNDATKDSIDRSEVERYLAMDENELFLHLVPPSLKSLYSDPETPIARGREIFNETLRHTQEEICAAYREHKERVNGAIDLTAILATAFSAQTEAHGLPAMALAALVWKQGLSELCA